MRFCLLAIPLGWLSSELSEVYGGSKREEMSAGFRYTSRGEEAVLDFINVAKVKVGGLDDGAVYVNGMGSRMMPKWHAEPKKVAICVVNDEMGARGQYQ